MKKTVAVLCAVAMMLTVFAACGKTVPVSRGTITEATYESAYLGIGFLLPDGFTFATDDMIAEQYGVTYDGQPLDTVPIIYDMFAGDEAGNSVSITMESIPLMDSPERSPKQYLKNLADTMGLYYEQMSPSAAQSDITTVTIADRTIDALVITVDFSGMNMFITYACEVCGDRMITYSFLTQDETTYGTLLNGFYRPDATLG